MKKLIFALILTLMTMSGYAAINPQTGPTQYQAHTFTCQLPDGSVNRVVIDYPFRVNDEDLGDVIYAPGLVSRKPDATLYRDVEYLCGGTVIMHKPMIPIGTR